MSSLWQLQANSVFDTDKNQAYLDVYDAVLHPFKDKQVRILELGIHRSGSLKLWASYFQNGSVYGFDLDPPQVDDNSRIRVAAGDQANADSLRAAMDAWGVDRFDIIVDDASHLGHLAAASFAILFGEHLNAGGVYFLEDWGTGYWPEWPDGEAVVDLASAMAGFAQRPSYPSYNKAIGQHRIPSHSAGMVGLLKFLVDVMAAPDQTHGEKPAMITGIDIRMGVAVIRKA